MSTTDNTAPALHPQNQGIQAALDLLHARRAALASIWTEASKKHDAFELLEIGGRQAELEGIIRMLRGAA